MKILCVVGTRPEAIKMAPVILGLQKAPWADLHILSTTQHRDLLDQVFTLYGIQPDRELNIMHPNQTLPDLTARLIPVMDQVLQEEKPDAVLAQGDTTTVFVSALASFYRKINFGHVEAGLRTGNPYYPFPEEMNRVLATRLARWHFAPTESCRQALLAEGIDAASIHVTGNTVIDSLMMTADKNISSGLDFPEGRKIILVTAHRRENFGEPFREICRAIRALAEANEKVHFVYPVHPNPNVQKPVHEILAGHPRITLCEPLDYGPFVSVMKQAYFILTDSGGVQEEAPALAKPVLVLRNETERPEAVDEGVVRLVGPNYEKIVTESQKLLDDEGAYQKMARGTSPYGDGKAASRIIEVLENESG